MASLLEDRNLVGGLTGVESISRAGRNCTIGLMRKPTQPATARGAASTTMTMDSSASGTNAAPHSARAAPAASTGANPAKSAKVSTVNIMHIGNDSKLAFGKGIREDTGTGKARSELCSSPRPHPELNQYLIAQFEEGRRSAFVDIANGIDQLELLDTAAVEDELLAREPSVLGGMAVHERRRREEEESALKLLTARSHNQGNQTPTKQPRHGHRSPTTPGHGTSPTTSPTNPEITLGAHHPVVPPLNLSVAAVSGHFESTATMQSPNAGRSDLAGTGALSPTQMRIIGASPRPKIANPPSASFKSPERFMEIDHNLVYPPVGHYRPKYGNVEHAGHAQHFLPFPTNQSRIPPALVLKDDIKPLMEVLTDARNEVKPIAVAERKAKIEAIRMNDAASDDDFDGTSRKRGAGPPEPSHNSSSPFKSRVAACVVASNPTAAPDTMYWPVADNGTKKSPRSFVDFSKHTPRPPLALADALPDVRSNPSAFTKDVARNAPDLGKYSPRSSFETRRVAPDGVLRPEKADPVCYARVPAADFGVPSPRSRLSPVRQGVSVEEVAEIKFPAEKAVPSPTFAKMRSRPDIQPLPNYPQINPSLEPISHRTPVATIRPDACGHGSVFTGRHAGAEIGAYNPNINAVRPKALWSIEFGKGLERAEHRANIADLQYDFKVPSPRTTGNPMMASQVSRTKRDAVLETRTAAADVTYDVKLPTSKANGMIEIGRQVERRDHVGGRGMPSDRTRDRQRKEHDAAQIAAETNVKPKATTKSASQRSS